MPSIVDTVTYPFKLTGTLIWDAGLAAANLVLPEKPVGKVVPAGCPGHGGDWPAFTSPNPGDSRSACPALNAMANHGILPRDGRNIKFTDMTETIRTTYNFGPAFCYFVPMFSARMLGRDYRTGTFDLHELNLHNGIEHDASLTRHDIAVQTDQGYPDPALVHSLLAKASGEGGKILTVPDLSRALAERRAHCKLSNPQFTESTFHDIFGSSNSATMLTIFGGRVDDLKTMLLEERIPDGWESRIRSAFGLTMAAFNFTVLPVEIGARQGAKEKVNKRSD